jgi:hypothetical protein
LLFQINRVHRFPIPGFSTARQSLLLWKFRFIRQQLGCHFFTQTFCLEMWHPLRTTWSECGQRSWK